GRTYGSKFRHSESEGWYAWDGHRWQQEHGEKMVKHCAAQMIRGLVDFTVGLPDDDSYRKRIESVTNREMRRTMRDNLLSFAINEPALSISVESLDQHPMLLTCGNGSLDLETGVLRPSSPGDLLSRWTPANYVPDAPRDLWLRFLDDIYLGDEELIAYIKRT